MRRSHPNLPHPTSGLGTFAQGADAIHYSNDGVWSDGRTTQATAVLQMDGNWYPIAGSLVADPLSAGVSMTAAWKLR